MDINEYAEFYKLPIGTKVIIKECHSRPEVVGKAATVAGWVDTELFHYPLIVMLDEPVYLPIPGAPLAIPFQGPHFCRADELELLGGDIPDIIKKSFEGD